MSISLGQYPIVKKLNNGKYILISSIGIGFLDETLTEESKIISFDDEIETRETIIEQFSSEDGGYIIVFLKNDLYFFSENENLIKKVENITFDHNNENYYSIVPYGHLLDDFYFALIFCNNEKLIYLKGTFDSTTDDIYFSDSSELDTTYTSYIMFFSCTLMNYNNKNVINCIFGNYNEFTLTNYDPKKQFQEEEDLPTLFINTENLGYKYFKSTTLPGKNESILCYFDFYNYYLNCSKYNIIQNKIIKFAIINLSEESLNPYCMFIKYFPETEQILIGLIDFIHDLWVAQCTKDLLCTDIFLQIKIIIIY